MITQDDLHQLKGLAPEQQFYMLEQIARDRLECEQPNGQRAYDDLHYMMAVLAAAKEYGIEELTHFKLPSTTDDDWRDICRDFRAEATLVSHQLLIRHGSEISAVALNPATKEKISHLLSQMREAVQKADVAAEKKDRLFSLIDRLQYEVDREMTPVHAYGELFITICAYMGEGVKKLEPAVQLIERIAGALGEARDALTGPWRLPTRREPKRLEPPKGNSAGDGLSVEDEIPF
jgi:hypothetical protein